MRLGPGDGCPKCSVFLDGEKQKYAIEVDTDAGWLIRCMTHNGELVIDRDKDEITRERIHGDVKVVCASEVPHLPC